MIAHILSALTLDSTLWLVIGFLGQGMFMSRFLIQWFQSEREGRSVIPVAFWYFSILGGVVTLAYAVHKMDPVFIAGQAAGLIVYARNLFLIRRERKALEAATARKTA